MKNNETEARDKFIEDVQELGFPVNIQGGKALRQCNKGPLSEQPTESKTSVEGAFIQRKPGMPFAEFKKACIKLFEERGLFKLSDQLKAERERLAKESST